MINLKRVEFPIQGMDCAECTRHVQRAIAGQAGVDSVEVYLTTQKAVVQLDPAIVDLASLQRAVSEAGYTLSLDNKQTQLPPIAENLSRSIQTFLGLLFGSVLFIVVVGEWFGLFAIITKRVPFLVGFLLVLISGYPVFLKVIKATLQKQIVSHSLMTLGVVAALAVGEWATAGVVVFFMRVGDYVERFTLERARQAVKRLVEFAPLTARVLRANEECEVPVEQVRVGEVVVVRPGEKIPVDGDVLDGQATIDQSTITGESMPVEAGPGAKVLAATLIRLGSLRIRTLRIGSDSTYGKVIQLVEQAEANRAQVQLLADKFSAYYLPVVAGIALLTFIIGRNPLATAAVLVVACSCSFALATPIAMLASIGAGAKRGLLIKGGKYLEVLARADTLLIDKTGTITLGRPKIVSIHSVTKPGNPAGLQLDEKEILRLAASAERYSEHPLAEALRVAAREAHLTLVEPSEFETLPGLGIRARVGEHLVTIGRNLLFAGVEHHHQSETLAAQGKTIIYLGVDGQLVGILAAQDTLRSEVPLAIATLRNLHFTVIELLTGDNQQIAASIAGNLAIRYKAELLPQDKIEIVRQYQAQGRTVVMVGDGINDAPALAQADVGIALGNTASDLAIEAAHITLLRDDWTLVPELVEIARRTMQVVKLNFALTLLYNLLGLSFAALGLLPPIFAAAAQSLPDLAILANSARLLRQKSGESLTL